MSGHFDANDSSGYDEKFKLFGLCFAVEWFCQEIADEQRSRCSRGDPAIGICIPFRSSDYE